ncbi:LrgB family protein [Pseudoalteromonas ulvae]|uniref:CidB/LrgB family autolysis modulator n=1 Tax=Pseudoalteromonas ulvae TaxID=107327 RepID=A0A244CT64_PSEDV|nr:LrgB family protein [Pseudoalteromonas ulvae]OUL58646.1 hypothetical protein B1199_10040 [Pseudoalteromonas ulvae]
MMLLIGLPLTIGLFFIFRWLQQQLKLTLLNPILLSIITLIAILSQLSLPYADYKTSTTVLTWLLEPAIVALALPLYKEYLTVKDNLHHIGAISVVAVCSSMTLSVLIAFALEQSFSVQASLATNSVTTPIALSVTESIAGIPALAAVVVILVGIFGAVFALPFLRLIGVKNPKAQGLAMGAACHAIGTARALESHPTMGGYASLAMALSAIMTAILVPILFPILQKLLDYLSISA